ncbi:hypothetical protein [Halobacillus karajensis]|uniref:Uncharacterized protein n=1 Tax=Halobacillus karajensis TaxID=195088 RepID=A0A024P811_9BACI|nr:hypothetical protein [Halobacillus karajensis]CDQ21085.1 hypothetical protein BN982_03448 [Halobacillus karajensis]CDQ24851.1 hypothetical protein BN983_03150 [Halobacillus karajensis]CDQ28789.1 hypothetical protein BN981_03104 [Halobacillus karajensis]
MAPGRPGAENPFIPISAGNSAGCYHKDEGFYRSQVQELLNLGYGGLGEWFFLVELNQR